MSQKFMHKFYTNSFIFSFPSCLLCIRIVAKDDVLFSNNFNILLWRKGQTSLIRNNESIRVRYKQTELRTVR